MEKPPTVKSAIKKATLTMVVILLASTLVFVVFILDNGPNDNGLLGGCSTYSDDREYLDFIHYDSMENVYGVGRYEGINIPVTDWFDQTSSNKSWGINVVKFSATGQLEYSYIGGKNYDTNLVYSTVDNNDNLILLIETYSDQVFNQSVSKQFVLISIDPDGNPVVLSEFGSNFDREIDISDIERVDTTLYIIGDHRANFEEFNPTQVYGTASQSISAYILQLDLNGTVGQYSIYHAENGDSFGDNIAVLEQNIYAYLRSNGDSLLGKSVEPVNNFERDVEIVIKLDQSQSPQEFYELPYSQNIDEITVTGQYLIISGSFIGQQDRYMVFGLSSSNLYLEWEIEMEYHYYHTTLKNEGGLVYLGWGPDLFLLDIGNLNLTPILEFQDETTVIDFQVSQNQIFILVRTQNSHLIDNPTIQERLKGVTDQAIMVYSDNEMNWGTFFGDDAITGEICLD